jgi:pimeloyl-ACP methyl ester carboxylesterase
MYATLYINQHPDKVAGAVLMEHGPLNGQMYDAIIGDLYDLDDDHARADYHRLLGMRDSQPKFHQSQQDPAPVWRLGAVASRCLTKSGLKDGKGAYDFTDHLSAFSKPVLFIASAWNEVIGVTFQERQRKFFRVADLVTIPDSGHDMQWVQPAATLAAIHTYLQRVK